MPADRLTALVEKWRRKTKHTYSIWDDAADDLAACLADVPLAPSGWQPIETAPKDAPLIFWVLPKTPSETYQDSSGKPICVSGPPRVHRGKYGTWSGLEKATHWQLDPLLTMLPPAPTKGTT